MPLPFTQRETFMRFTTRQIHSGVTPDPATGSLLTPIYQTTTYVQPSIDEYLAKGYSHSRSGKIVASISGGAEVDRRRFSDPDPRSPSDGCQRNPSSSPWLRVP